jgi:hypothetical protein
LAIAATAIKGQTVSKNMNCTNVMSTLAEDLDCYLRARADVEGVGYELSPEFFAEAIKMGVEFYFGIEVDLVDGVLVQDRQEPRPGFFEAWQKSNRG